MSLTTLYSHDQLSFRIVCFSVDVESVPQCLKEASSAVVLRKSISFLYQHLDPDIVVPMLTEKSLLSTSEAEELASYKHGTAKSIALVDKMLRKAGDANLSLIDTLKRIPEQEYIGMRLTQGISYKKNFEGHVT